MPPSDAHVLPDVLRLFEFLKAAPAAIVFDADYRNQDEEYLDAQATESHP